MRLISEEGKPNGNYLEILNCLLSIEYHPADWQHFCDFRQDFLRVGGGVAEKGWSRASRVYTVPKDSPTKPSYLKRLIDYPDRPRKAVADQGGLDQLAKIAIELAKKPGYSNLSFVFLRPADLHDQFRPGYVPCPIAGDFKFRDGKLQLSVMFRTNDAFAVGYADLYYMRQIQLDVLKEAQRLTESDTLQYGKPGNLNMFFARTYIEKSKVIKMADGQKRVQVRPLVEKLIQELEIYR
ncbi:MAG TPA: hypothetical protein VKA82_14150 [Rubrobacter sp.]|nr:hypothetical protein [Rubrobacter sp.]